MSRISGKLALITGATSGIGEACARRFAAGGANLALWARRKDRLDALAAELSALGVKIETAVVDVRSRGAVESAAKQLSDAPDILLNNAGLAAGFSKLHEGDPDDWDRMIDTNVKGLLLVSRAVVPLMVARGRGHIVNIGSTAGHQVYPMGNVYNASKFAVRALNEAMNVDLAGTALRVSSVDPGYVETEFAKVRFAGDEARAAKVYEGFRPLSGDDVAGVIDYIVNLPEHMNILDCIVLPTPQRNQHVVHRQGIPASGI
jgi:serine 3-dehydrogenase